MGVAGDEPPHGAIPEGATGVAGDLGVVCVARTHLLLATPVNGRRAAAGRLCRTGVAVVVLCDGAWDGFSLSGDGSQ
ncbi:hypothetical protein D3C81_1346140 [compost metagenome]